MSNIHIHSREAAIILWGVFYVFLHNVDMFMKNYDTPLACRSGLMNRAY